jgi:hypothetical protein
MNQSISNLSPEDKYKSVTIDFLRSLPELDVDNNKNHLMAALHVIGFDVSKKIDSVDNVNIRYRHSPMHLQRTVHKNPPNEKTRVPLHNEILSPYIVSSLDLNHLC